MHDGDAHFANKTILFRLPPLAVAGRWASVDSSLTDLVQVHCRSLLIGLMLLD